MNESIPHQETPQAALLRRGNDYAEFERLRDERERVEPLPEIYRNRPPHSDERLFAIIRAEVKRWRYWAGYEYNANAWMTESQTFTDQQRVWLGEAAGALELQLTKMNQQTQEVRS